MKQMHPGLKRVFDEHAAPKHIRKRDVHDQLSPILKVVGKVQRQLVEYRALLAEAELEDHDGALDGTMEHIHQTFGALEREANAFVEHGRKLAQAFAQLDRYMAEQQSVLGVPETPTPDTPLDP